MIKFRKTWNVYFIGVAMKTRLSLFALYSMSPSHLTLSSRSLVSSPFVLRLSQELTAIGKMISVGYSWAILYRSWISPNHRQNSGYATTRSLNTTGGRAGTRAKAGAKLGRQLRILQWSMILPLHLEYGVSTGPSCPWLIAYPQPFFLGENSMLRKKGKAHKLTWCNQENLIDIQPDPIDNEPTMTTKIDQSCFCLGSTERKGTAFII